MSSKRRTCWSVLAVPRRGQGLTLQSALDPHLQPVKIDGFLNTIENTLTERFASISDVSHSSHYHHHRSRRHRIDESAQLEPRSARQVNVGKNKIEDSGSNQTHRFFSGRRRNAGKFIAEKGQQRRTRVIIIFYDEY